MEAATKHLREDTWPKRGVSSIPMPALPYRWEVVEEPPKPVSLPEEELQGDLIYIEDRLDQPDRQVTERERTKKVIEAQKGMLLRQMRLVKEAMANGGCS